MSQQPLVTILLPTYKRARYLAEAIPSALAQTYGNFELLVLDDASPDNTAEVVRSFESDPRVRYIRHPQNRGLPGNWRAGLEIASGEYLCVLEDDDLLAPHFIERLLAPLLATPRTLFSFCDHWVVREDGTQNVEATATFTRNYGRATLPEGPVSDAGSVVLLNQSVSLTAALFRRHLLTPDLIDDAARGAMDLWLAYHCLRAEKDGIVHYIPERLMNYRVHDAAMSNQAPVYVSEGLVYVYARIAQDDAFLDIREAVQRKLHIYQTALGYRYLSMGRHEDARSVFAQSRQSGESFPARIGATLAQSGMPGMKLVRLAQRIRRGR